MTTFMLAFSVDNAAFVADSEGADQEIARNAEIVRILCETAERIGRGERLGELRIADVNGNGIGKASIID